MPCTCRLGYHGTVRIWLHGGSDAQVVAASESMGQTHVLRGAERKSLLILKQVEPSTEPALCTKWRRCLPNCASLPVGVEGFIPNINASHVK
jgi:hypothetical protein